MAITVISALPGSALPASGSTGGTAGEDASGGFAALLSGELLGQMGIAAELLGGLVTEESTGQPAAEDIPDAALFAALFGHLAGAGVVPEGTAPTADAATGDDLLVGSGGGRTMPELPVGKTTPQAADGTFEKLLGNGRDAVAAALGGQTANIAGKMEAGETPAVAAGQLAAGSAATSATSATGAAAGHAANTAQPSVAAPLHSPAWPQQFGDKIVWLARNAQQTAQLNINPPQLGPVQVTVNLSGDQASIAFASPHADVRQAIESAMPQLKEMLSAAGINLGQANVGANLQQQRGDTPFGDANGARLVDENAILPANEKGASTTGTVVVQRGRGLVDLFA